MALPGLRNHPKFRRLQMLLQMPVVYVAAHLQAMWDVGYESANPLLGDDIDVELAAEWGASGRETGAFFRAVLQTGWIDDVGDGRFAIHDLLDHAPKYVVVRHRKWLAQQKERECEQCHKAFRSGESHAKFCSSACRVAHHRVTHGNEGVRNSNAPDSSCNAVTSPAQPSPETPLTPQGGNEVAEAFAESGITDQPPRPAESDPPRPPQVRPAAATTDPDELATTAETMTPQERQIRGALVALGCEAFTPDTVITRLSALAGQEGCPDVINAMRTAWHAKPPRRGKGMLGYVEKMLGDRAAARDLERQRQVKAAATPRRGFVDGDRRPTGASPLTNFKTKTGTNG